MGEFHWFEALARRLVEVDEKICRLRPVQGEAMFSEQEKTAEPLHREVAQEVDRLLEVIFSQRRHGQGLDLEAVEMAMRSALHRDGAGIGN